MRPERAVAIAVLAGRIGYGAALIAVPERMTAAWLGPAAGGAPVQVPVRALGAREVVLHAGALRAALAGAPVRGWMAASVAGDLTDLAVTALGRRELPPGVTGRTLAVAGGSALVSAFLAAKA
jgi:hypothetical protein